MSYSISIGGHLEGDTATVDEQEKKMIEDLKEVLVKLPGLSYVGATFQVNGSVDLKALIP